jgi:hypothetical protein
MRFIASETPTAGEQAALANVRAALDEELRRESTPPGPHRHRRVDCPVSQDDDWNTHLVEVKGFLRTHEGAIRRASQEGLRVVMQTTVYPSDVTDGGEYVCLTVWFDRDALSLLVELNVGLDMCFYIADM